MPHAEEQSKMSTQTMTNGDSPSSHFISHLTSYPVVSDGIKTFKENQYGAKSIEVADATYSRFGKPIVPYLRTPYSYAAPYVAKADSLADASLNTVDNHFPIVKEDTKTLYDTAVSWAFWPLHLAGDGKNYLFGTWNDEYSKTAKKNNRGDGVSTAVMALISTEMKVASDALQAVADFLGPKKEQAKDYKDQFVSQTKQKKDAYSTDAKKTKDSYATEAKKTKDQYAEKVQEKTQ